MKRSFLIFLFAYLLGATMSPLLAKTELESDHSQWFALANDASETESDLKEWMQKSPDFSGNKHFFFPGYFAPTPSRFTSIPRGFDQQSASAFRLLYRPFYLLFHAFLFYDLHR